jgi:hypothetical protein
MIKKFKVIGLILLIVIPVFSFEYPFLNFDEMLFLTPFSHYSSIEGLRNKNSFNLDFNGINIINPITGEKFLSPSLSLIDDLQYNDDYYNFYRINSEIGKRSKIGFFRNGFSLKSENTINIVNSLYINYYKNNFTSSFIISNYGNSYTHYKDFSIGPGIESFLKWESDNLIFNFYLNYKKSDNSTYPINELETSQPVEFSDSAKASSSKKFIGITLNYHKKTEIIEYKILSSLSYGSSSRQGENSSSAFFDSEDMLWDKNYPHIFKNGFLSFKNIFSFLRKTSNNSKIKFSFKADYTNSSEMYNLPLGGIIYDDNLKLVNYGYDFKATELNLSPAIYIVLGGTKKLTTEIKAAYNMYLYSIEKYSNNINLGSFDYLFKIFYNGQSIKSSIGYSSFSKPLNLIKLMYLSNNFTPYMIFKLHNNNWEQTGSISTLTYTYDESKKFNKINKFNLKTEYQINNDFTIILSALFSKMKYFWDKSYNTDKKEFIIGAVKSSDNILFIPERKYMGFNLSINKTFDSGFLYSGVTYMINKGNYNNDFNSIVSSYLYSNLFLDKNVQGKFAENFNLSYGNGLKFYLYSEINIINNLDLNIYFVHMPPINMINYKIGDSSMALIPDTLENSSKSLNLLSLELGYKTGKMGFFIGLKNILNSTPIIIKNGIDNTPLLKYQGFSSIIGINYNY